MKINKQKLASYHPLQIWRGYPRFLPIDFHCCWTCTEQSFQTSGALQVQLYHNMRHCSDIQCFPDQTITWSKGDLKCQHVIDTSMLMDGTCKTKIQIAIMHGISGGGGSIPSTPSSGKFSLMELIKLFIRIVKLLLKWQTNKKSLSNLVLGRKKNCGSARGQYFHLVSCK